MYDMTNFQSDLQTLHKSMPDTIEWFVWKGLVNFKKTQKQTKILHYVETNVMERELESR